MTTESKKKFKVLFVCTGNTCRSPMAEGILKSALKKKGVRHVDVSSAGTHGLHFAPASVFGAQIAKQKGVDLFRHRSRELTADMIKGANLILVMAQEHLDHISRIAPNAVNKTFLLRTFARVRGASNRGGEEIDPSVKDPIGGSLEEYQRSFSEIETEIERILPELLQRAK
jgi:protein-tyrosine-phosphatase